MAFLSPIFARNAFRALDDVFARELAPPLLRGAQHALQVEGSRSPAIDVDESATEFTITADLPGAKREDIKLAFEGDRSLTLSGEIGRTRLDTEGTAPTKWLSERLHGTYARRIAFPTPVDESKVKASFADGVLSVSIPKQEPEQPRNIAIE